MAIVPCEYGLNRAQKVKIGISITKKLLEKIHGDLVWWKNQYVMNLLQPIVNSNKEFQYENRQWHDQGLDKQSLTADMIKSHWRYVRTRLYFTSASHMYSLLNVVKFGIN